MKSEAQEQLAQLIGMTIAEVRTQRGLTQEQVAQRLDLHPESISRIERGAVLPSIVRLVEFAEIFDCAVQDLFGSSTGSVDDSTIFIQKKLKYLSRIDRHYVLQMVDLACHHLRAK